MKDAQDEVSTDTLAKAPKRALAFLSGVSRNPAARQCLAQFGYTDETHQEGWSLLNATGGGQAAIVGDAQSPGAVASALAELGAWSVRMFTVADASLRHAHPAQHAYIFQGGLTAQPGNDAVVAVGTFLRRLDGLERDAEREPSRAADWAALDRLHARGLGEEERARVQRLVDTVHQGVAAPEGPSKAAASANAARLTLYYWFDEWSQIARIAIARRDLLIRLGLASPRKAAKPEAAKPGAAKPAREEPAAPVRTVPPARPSIAPSPN